MTPNRGDCLSVFGIAREVAAITGCKPKPCHPERPARRWCSGGSEGSHASKGKIKDFISVEVREREKCPRYCARVITGVKIRPSSVEIAGRLTASGIRPVNNVVDATNYIMLQTGQPFHAFDFRFIRGGKILVDMPKKAVDFATLDGVTRKILSDDLMIMDGAGPVAIAGVMGGANSEVKPDTDTIVLESACFKPESVRRTAKRLGLSSESSKRFERGVDPSEVASNLAALTALILKVAGGEASDAIDVYPKAAAKKKIRFSPRDVSSLLGIEVPAKDIKKYFNFLGIAYANNICTVPTYRRDIIGSADLTEEIARLHGYDKIPINLPEIKMSAVSKPDAHSATFKAKNFLVSHGFFEAVNYGFCSPQQLESFAANEPVTLSNPLGVEFQAMKSSLVPGLLENIRHNISHGQDNIKLFEIRPIFASDGAKISEEIRLAGVMCGTRSGLTWAFKSEEADFFDAKGICEALAKHIGAPRLEFKKAGQIPFLHPQASAAIQAGGKEIGLCGLLHPGVASRWDIKKDVCLFDLKWSEWAKLSNYFKPKFKPAERFPKVRRDVALLINDSISAAEITAAVSGFGSKLIRDAKPFDIYKGKGIAAGKKSIAWAIMYASDERTLTDEEVNNAHSGLISYLKDKLGAEVR
ncbi:MAG: phenylalanine--tRNA ligase subunit beta [Deltaproteobacteria bacterium]|nr:phenylalanine--tRNA ligase subunit beta [Deltaproteobacteria bacterium]